MSLHAIYRFQIATSFSNEANYEEIAKKCGLTEAQTRRILRHAMSYHVFRESSKGLVAHTSASKLLATNPVVRDSVGFLAEECWPAATRVGNTHTAGRHFR